MAQALRKQIDGGDVRFLTARRALRRLRDTGLEVVLMLDEFESLARNAQFEPDFYGELRSLAGELGLVILTASKRSLYDLTYENSSTLSSPFFNIFSEMPIGLMTDDDARQILIELSGQAGHGVLRGGSGVGARSGRAASVLHAGDRIASVRERRARPTRARRRCTK